VRSASTAERLGSFSDAVFAVIITIMVLELKPPVEPTFAALGPLWPTVLSYIVSYLFIAIVWVNHHHLMRFVDQPTSRLIWVNFVHLFFVSLVPFSTAWVAQTRFAAVPVAVYAGVFVLVNAAYVSFVRIAVSQASDHDMPAKTQRMTKLRSEVTLAAFAVAGVVALTSPAIGFALVCAALFTYLRPEPPGTPLPPQP
jgi:uncharacterized membrane protein